jgi:TFIIF-interacting CTD phosphatase-like protein
VKDLRLIGRDLATTLIIDNIEKNFSLTTPDNGIHIEDFVGSFEDTELAKIKAFLKKLAL